MQLSSIPPQNFKFHILHNDNAEGVRIKMWFPKQQRLDVYTEGRDSVMCQQLKYAKIFLNGRLKIIMLI